MFWLKLILLFLLTGSIAEAAAIQTPFTPPHGKTLFLMGGDPDAIAHYVSATGQTPAGITFYTSIQKVEGLREPSDVGSGPMDGEALLKSFPDSVIHIGLYMVDGMKGTIAGEYDTHLKELAQWIIKANRPVYLRIGYEFDNPENHYDPREYKQGFRYVVDYLRKAGVHNAAYVWHSECTPFLLKPGQQVMDWYPGDEYVDWFAASMFSMPAAIWNTSSFVKLAREHRKPVMIAESSPWGMYTRRGKMDWFKKFFQFIQDQNIEAFCYFNYDWDKWPMWRGQNIGDGRIEVAPDTKEFWVNKIKQERFLKASRNLFKILGWRQSFSRQPD